ncbi:Catechol 2,3-dioxygenase [Pseudomonas pohangensis]|jgi:catechol 2,3-dioxygenase-like lactoylglutathione lyase family enzyme|uniref:Bleomycin resistance protein n=1 Tax=Pseudomonas pohangensis TaxID=364197 RepID=A0A1H2G7E7_9PSED|nr:VOC family protein [Pseudomonas pohangensis]SDU15401.1 Catechol 2,3-dioxygenase [Pseudomonas pohangensis]
MASIDIFPPLTPELNVRCIKKSLSFYTELLGFTICFERPEDGFATIALDGAVLMLEQIEELAPQNDPWITAELEYPFGRGINFQITVKNLDGIYSRLMENDYPIQLPLEQKTYRVGGKFVSVRQFMIIDPDGYLLRLNSLANVNTGVAQV